MIRKGTTADLAAIVENNRLMALETEDLALDLEKLEPGVLAVLSGAQPATYWVVEEDAVITAQLMLTYEWSDWRNATVWWIQSVYVAEAARGKGAYKRLYQHVLDEARREGAAGIRLYVDQRNERAQAVYTKLDMNGDHYRVFEAMF